MKAEFTNRAYKDLAAIDKVAQKQILKKLKFYLDSPRTLSYAKKLTEFEDGGYRFRVGTYRIVFDATAGLLTILRIQHRRDIYRRK